MWWRRFSKLVMSELRFDGRVAIVTGAGGGLGKEYALLLGSRGAAVVVNDLGGDRKGIGASSSLADNVAGLIKSNGGKAVANYDSVLQGEKIVKTALDNYGRIDIVINNAGILRDRSFARISDDDWDIIQQVHLKGSFVVTRAAWPHMRKQSYGRVIVTSSTSGLYGNFGQANYSAAKMGVLGMCNTLCLEGQKYNILCNTIAPTAYSRLTADLFPPEFEELFQPRLVAPVVTYLCHDSCEESGGVFEVGGGWAAKLRWQKSTGALMKKDNEEFTLEDVRDNWEKVCDMTNPVYHKSGAESMTTVAQLAKDRAVDSGATGNEDGGVLNAIGYSFKLSPFTYTSRDVILYALGVGAALSPDNQSELKFLYERHEDFAALPTFGVIPAQQGMVGMATGEVPHLKLDVTKILHGEQYIEFEKPIPTSGTLYSKATIVDIVDKRKGTLILIDVVTTDDTNEVVCKNQFSTFVVGMTGTGGKTSSPHAKPLLPAPQRLPDSSRTTTTLETQAAIYRLSGDLNPLHIDNQFAAIGGFSTPILHGLCSYGIAVRHVLQQYAAGDPDRIGCVKARFSKPVIPGQTIQTDMWKEGNRIHFSCKVVENGNEVLSGGYVELKAAANDSQEPALKSTAMFEAIAARLKSSPELVNKVQAVFQWDVTEGGNTVAQWTIDVKNSPGQVYSGPPKSGKPGCTLVMSDDDIMKMISGELDAQKAYFKGKLKISGNIMLSQKLGMLLKDQAKL